MAQGKTDRHCVRIGHLSDHEAEALRTTPAKALGVADRVWSIAHLVDAALAVAPSMPTETPPDRRRKFVVIDGGKD